MVDGDEILVSVNSDAPWGHAARNQLMPAARGDALLFIDDDDAYVEGALDVVRARFAEVPDRVHVFRMRYADGRELWQLPEVACGNVSTQMVIAPRSVGLLGQWGSRYEGDFDFIAATCWLLGQPLFHEDVIALVRPE
jgi:glycosyltransferase involved in cell wall biosynthesis